MIAAPLRASLYSRTLAGGLAVNNPGLRGDAMMVLVAVLVGGFALGFLSCYALCVDVRPAVERVCP